MHPSGGRGGRVRARRNTAIALSLLSLVCWNVDCNKTTPNQQRSKDWPKQDKVLCPVWAYFLPRLYFDTVFSCAINQLPRATALLKFRLDGTDFCNGSVEKANLYSVSLVACSALDAAEREATFVRISSNGLISERDKSDVWDP